MVQQRLDLGGTVQAGVQCDHIIPRPVEKSHFPAAMGTGQCQIAGVPQVAFNLLEGKPGGIQTFSQTFAK